MYLEACVCVCVCVCVTIVKMLLQPFAAYNNGSLFLNAHVLESLCQESRGKEGFKGTSSTFSLVLLREAGRLEAGSRGQTQIAKPTNVVGTGRLPENIQSKSPDSSSTGLHIKQTEREREVQHMEGIEACGHGRGQGSSKMMSLFYICVFSILAL